MENKYTGFEEKISYVFKDKSLLDNALTHSSYANEHKSEKSNERLEFLGDAILDAVVSRRLYDMYPGYDEGKMSKIRSEIVREESLEKFAKKIDIDKYIKLGKSEVMVHGETKGSILSDCFEAVLGAIYLDSDFNSVEKWIDSVIKPGSYNTYINAHSDHKTELQELVKKQCGDVSYKVLKESGPQHDKTFEIAVFIDDEKIAVGKAASKKKAEQNAAFKALKKMRG